ncbi:NAD(P)/FAD-dependent oxidoreductase [Pseudochelatococcus sp. B33]
MPSENIVIIGASHAGVSLAAKLREARYGGDLYLVGDESDLPYERPPLSKAYFLGQLSAERMLLRSAEFYRQRDIELRLSCRVEAIDPVNRTVYFGGKTLTYDKLALVTGARPRQLPVELSRNLGGIQYVRTRADVDRMMRLSRSCSAALVIGGGYIGLEAAAAFRSLGMAVTLVENAPRILTRVASAETSAFFRKLHTDRGVRIMESTGVTELLGEDTVTGAVLTNGETVDVGLVVAGIGVIPNTELAQSARVQIDNGIVVDRRGRTSIPGIWAAGDCASFPYRDGRIRLESVQNAVDQSAIVAQDMLGQGEDYAPVPWFWSDQFDVKLQIAGLNTGYDQVVVRRGAGEAQSHWYFRRTELLSVDAINDARSYMLARRLLAQGKSVDPASVSSPDTDLMALLRS